MSIYDKMTTLIWYLFSPRFYGQFWKCYKKIYDPTIVSYSMFERISAIKWCEQQAIDSKSAFNLITNHASYINFFDEFKGMIESGMNTEGFTRDFGGAGDLAFIYNLSNYLKATRVIETGVAFGWSSLAILLSLQDRADSKLISVDLPYKGKEDIVGMVVPDYLRDKWELIKMPDREGVPLALQSSHEFDLCHYDSDKTYAGRISTYHLLWKSLRKNGVFVSDDIGDNLAFRDYCKSINKKPIIFKFRKNQLCGTKYVGLILKD